MYSVRVRESDANNYTWQPEIGRGTWQPVFRTLSHSLPVKVAPKGAY